MKQLSKLLLAAALMVCALIPLHAQDGYLTIFVTSPSKLMFSPLEGRYVPENFQFEALVANHFEQPLTDLRLELLCDDSARITFIDPPASAVVVDSVYPYAGPFGYLGVPWDVSYLLTEKEPGEVKFRVHASFVNPETGLPVDTLYPMNAFYRYDDFEPNVSVSLNVPDAAKLSCNGYDPPLITATGTVRNTQGYLVPATSVELQIPDDWSFAPGEQGTIMLNDTLDRIDEREFVWYLVAPVSDSIREHAFTMYLDCSPYYGRTRKTTMRTNALKHKLLADTPEMKAHLVYDAEAGAYKDDPFVFDFVVSAWGGSFPPLIVTAELIHGSWMFLELDGTAPGMEIIKNIPAMDICDSAVLHWQANIIKQNEYSTAFEGAIRYTVFSADSSIYREIVQPIIIDAVNQTAVDTPPAAADMQLSAYPNPFSERTMFAYTLPGPGYVSLTLYDIMGREHARIAEGFVSAGTHRVSLQSGGLAPGMYRAVLRTGQHVRSLPVCITAAK